MLPPVANIAIPIPTTIKTIDINSHNRARLVNDLSFKFSIFQIYNLPFKFTAAIKHENDKFNLRLKLKNNDEWDFTKLCYVSQILTIFKKFDLNLNLSKNVIFNSEFFLKFINKFKPILEFIGVEVDIPFRFEVGNLRFKLDLNIEDNSYFKFDDLKEYEWKISVNDEVISIDEFNELYDADSKLIEINGNFYEVDMVKMKAIKDSIVFLPQNLESNELLQISLLEQYRNIKFAADDNFKSFVNAESVIEVPKFLNLG